MQYLNVNGHDLLIDWGSMEFMSEVTGKDETNPLAGLRTKEIVGVILYGGTARYCEDKKQPVKHTYEQCLVLAKSLTYKQITTLTSAYGKFWQLDESEEDDVKEEQTEELGEKKS